MLQNRKLEDNLLTKVGAIALSFYNKQLRLPSKKCPDDEKLIEELKERFNEKDVNNLMAVIDIENSHIVMNGFVMGRKAVFVKKADYIVARWHVLRWMKINTNEGKPSFEF